MQIKLNSHISNVSLQIGDEAYYIPALNLANVNDKSFSPDQPVFLGVISGIGPDYIMLDDNTLNPGQTLVENDFIMFSKNKIVNNNSMLGYYAEVQLKNNSISEAELFALNSEAVISSK